jgi:glutamine synthetase
MSKKTTHDNNLVDKLREAGVDTLELGFGDMQGNLRGKRIPLERLPVVAHSGFAFCLGVLAWDTQCEVFPTEQVGWSNGYPDGHAYPDLATLRLVPWRSGTAFLLSDLVDKNGEPLAISPRTVLKHVLDQYVQAGLRPMVGAELEFYLFDDKWQPLFGGTQAYSLHHGGRIEVFLRDLRNKLQAFGIAVEASNTEYGPAQVEVNLVYGEALTIADNAVLFKYAVKEIARLHGLRASFMAKPWADQSGSGFHVHWSLQSLRGKTNLLANDKQLGLHAVAGLLATATDFSVLVAPSVNSYKRVRADSFVPVNASWGEDNRSVAVRSLLGRGEDSRLELRTGAADANPYLVIAAALAGALLGILEKQQPLAPVPGNAAQEEHLKPLPRSLYSALTEWEHSSWAERFFPEPFRSHYSAVCRHELEVYGQVVTQWERDRYLENS